MHIPRWGVCLLGVGCCGFVGCSQTSLLRPKGPSDMKTVASINGKPVSTVAGEPGSGSSQREDVDDLGPPPAAGSRISGRVFDEEGRAVPNARVRLGVGATAGGRVNFATTDRSGAFTLHGLRPGRDYTLIAEYQAEDGMMSGRVQAHAPDAGVRIALGARDAEPEPARNAKILPARVRSSLFPENETDGFPATAARPRVQDAEDPPDRDREPPAEEATSYAPRTKRASTARLASAPSSATVRAGWTVRQRPIGRQGPPPAHRCGHRRSPRRPAGARRSRRRGRRGRESAPAGARARRLRRVAVFRPHGLRLGRDRPRLREPEEGPGPTVRPLVGRGPLLRRSRARLPGGGAPAHPRGRPSPPRRRSHGRPMRGAGDGRTTRTSPRRPGSPRTSGAAPRRDVHGEPLARRRPAGSSGRRGDGRIVRGRHDSRPLESPAHLARAVDQPGRRAGRRVPAPQLGDEEETTNGMP